MLSSPMRITKASESEKKSKKKTLKQEKACLGFDGSAVWWQTFPKMEVKQG